jgi:hypothetical protein
MKDQITIKVSLRRLLIGYILTLQLLFNIVVLLAMTLIFMR